MSPRHRRGAYFFRHFGWADLLASVPLAQFKILRVFRLIRVYRLLRDVGIGTVGRALIRDRAGSSLYTLLIMGIFVLEFGSLSPKKKDSAPPVYTTDTRTSTVEGLRLSLEESEAKLTEIRKLLAGPTQ